MKNLVLSTRSLDEVIDSIANEVVNRIQFSDLQSSNKDISQDLLTRKEALKFLSISSPTLWRWEKMEKVKSHGIGGKRYYKRSELLGTITMVNK